MGEKIKKNIEEEENSIANIGRNIKRRKPFSMRVDKSFTVTSKKPGRFLEKKKKKIDTP